MEKIYEVAEVKTAETLAMRIRTTVKSTQRIMLDAAISIGNDLMEAKELVDHGEWENWIESNVGFSYSKAKKYMQISREYGEFVNEFGEFQKGHSYADLSYSNALKLLALPEEAREELIENNDIESLTVKELEEKIKAMKIINEEDAKDKEKLQKDLENEKWITNQLNKKIQDAEEELLQIEKPEDTSPAAAQELREKQAEIDKLLDDLAKNKTAKAKLEEKLAKADKEKEKEIEEARAKALEESREKLEEVKAQAKKYIEQELETARADIEKLTKELEAAGNESILLIKIKSEEIQGSFEDIQNAIENLEPERKAKMNAYITTVLTALMERIEG